MTLPVDRPGDPDLAYAAFYKHRERCAQCTDAGECPEGARLLEGWMRAADYWAMATSIGEGIDEPTH